jgi:hypothetical protein
MVAQPGWLRARAEGPCHQTFCPALYQSPVARFRQEQSRTISEGRQPEAATIAHPRLLFPAKTRMWRGRT